MGDCRGEKQNLDAVREPLRAVFLMKKSTTEGVFFWVGVCRDEKQNLGAVRKPLRAVFLMKKSGTEGVFFGGRLPW